MKKFSLFNTKQKTSDRTIASTYILCIHWVHTPSRALIPADTYHDSMVLTSPPAPILTLQSFGLFAGGHSERTLMFIDNPMPEQIDDGRRKSLLEVQTSTLGHLRDHGFVLGLTPNYRPIAFAGTAVTVRLPHLDSTALHVAADKLRPGDVLVVEQSGDPRSCFGGMVAFTAKTRGAEGVILAGAMNDFDEVLELGLPVYSNGVSARTTRILGVEGSINVPVTVGGCIVEPGDAVVADSDGIAVLNEDEIDEVVEILKQKEGAEPDLKSRISAGHSLAEWSGAAEQFMKGQPVA